MSGDMWLTLAILLLAIILFVTERLRVDVVALGVVITLMLTGILDTGEALAGFSSAPVLMIASLFIVGGAVFQTGLAAMIANRILQVAGTSETRLMVVLMVTVAVMSGFMSDTGVVAVMLPAVLSLAVSAKINASRLLIPLAYGSLLGGVGTLIGTPPNIIVSDFLAERQAAGVLIQGQPVAPFEFFSFTPLGVLMIAAGIIFMTTIGRRLLPDRKPVQELQQVETPSELLKVYQISENLFRLRVRSVSPLQGQNLFASRLGEDFNVRVMEIQRAPQARTLARMGEQRLMYQSSVERLHPTAETVLQQDNLLIVRGEGSDVGRAAAFWNLAIQPAEAEDQDAMVSQEVGVAEVLLPPRSALIDKTLVELSFGKTYRLTVLDIRRPDHEGRLDLKSTSLRFGDTLLVQGEWKDILDLKKKRRDFIVIGEPGGLNGLQNQHKAPVAAFVLLGMLVVMITNIIPFTTASMLAALAVVLTGCLTMDEAYEAIDWKSVVLIAGMLPMSTALVKVGLVDLIAGGLTETLGLLSPLAVMAGLFLLTSIFTQVLSNTATAVLLAPIAFAAAQNLDVQPYAFMMAVGVAASMAFASPVASPVNTLVMGAGSYRFSDYMRAGIPMIVLTLLIALISLPLLFPF